MDILWAPWRQTYVRGEKTEDCFICGKVRQRDDEEHFVLKRSSASIVLLNLYPYNAGHLMVCPVRHASSLLELDPVERCDLQDLLCSCQAALQETFKPDGFNIGLNIGAAAGAGLACHLHWHIVPRWAGDSNFMSAVAGARVLSQSLGDTYRLLLPALAAADARGHTGA